MNGPYMGPVGDQFAGADPQMLEDYQRAYTEALGRANRAEAQVGRLRGELAIALGNPCATCQARIEQLEQALREAVDVVSQGRRGQIGASSVYSAQVNVQTVDRWRAALHPDQRKARLYACRFNNATYAQPCDRCDGTCPNPRETT